MPYKRHRFWDWMAGEIPPSSLRFPYQVEHEQNGLLLFRCLSDRRLLTDRILTRQQCCVGHQMTNQVVLTWWERFLIEVGYIR